VTAVPVRLGVFGGACDPPHAAHHALVEAALVQLRLDAMLVLPTGNAWHKARPLSSARDRIAMAKLAYADLPQVSVDARETLREGPTYTVDTLQELQTEHPGATLFLVIGDDQARALQSWHDWEAVVQIAIICVAAREDTAGIAPRFIPPGGLESRFLQLGFPVLSISATDIRARVAAGQDIAPLVSGAVARYIADHHLYQSA
jgi:nicotinate-nucleotide adenylyltransferase